MIRGGHQLRLPDAAQRIGGFVSRSDRGREFRKGGVKQPVPGGGQRVGLRRGI